MTFNNLSFKKAFVSKTELRYSRQEIISNRSLFETMKIIRRRSIRTYHIYELQEFLALYHDEAIQQTTSAMIKIVKTVQVHNFLYFRKRE